MAADPQVATLAAEPSTAVARAQTPSMAQARRLAWAVWFVAIAFSLVGLWLVAESADLVLPGVAWGFRGFPALFALTFTSVGGIVISRRPGNVVGRLFAAAGVLAGVLLFSSEYARYGLLAQPGSLPGPAWAAWLASWIWVPLLIIIGPLLLLLFPNGRFVTPRWAAVAWLSLGGGLLAIVATAIGSGPITNNEFATNPIGVLDRATATPVFTVGEFGILASIPLAVASLVVRYRKAHEDERQQLKWVAAAAVLVGLVSPLGFTTSQAGQSIFIVVMCGIPIAAGIAILRYRLYDIDTIINRALVYGLLTAILAGVSTASIALLERIFQSAAGERSDTTIVLTTLIVVTAFNPIKNRLQLQVDRRLKDRRDPETRLAAFEAAITGRFSPLDPDLALTRLLEVAVEAFDAVGGSLDRVRRPSIRLGTAGGPAYVDAISISVGPEDGASTVSLGPRRGGAAYREQDRTALEHALTIVAAEIDRQGR